MFPDFFSLHWMIHYITNRNILSIPKSKIDSFFCMRLRSYYSFYLDEGNFKIKI